MGLTAILAGLFRRPGIWDFLKEQTKRRHQLKAEETRLGAISAAAEIAGACACDTGWGRRLFRHQHGRCATYSGDFHCETPPPSVDGSSPAQIEAESESAQETDG